MRATGPIDSPLFVVFAPGDMGRVDDPALHRIATGLGQAGLRVVPFDAPPYAEDGSNDARLADRIRAAAALRDPRQQLVLGGMSRGARVSASLVESLGAVALLGFAYPFHPRHDPDASRQVAQLAALTTPVWLFQGTRDSHGNRQQVRGYGLPDHVSVCWLEDANHALHPRSRSRSGFTLEGLLDQATERAASQLFRLAQDSASS